MSPLYQWCLCGGVGCRTEDGQTLGVEAAPARGEGGGGCCCLTTAWASPARPHPRGGGGRHGDTLWPP